MEDQRFQYRLRWELDGKTVKTWDIQDEMPNWDLACYNFTQRYDGILYLEKRLICGEAILPMVGFDKRYIKIKDGMVICPWDIFAHCYGNPPKNIIVIG